MTTTTTTTTATMQNIDSIDREIRDYIWGGCALSPEFEPYRDDFKDAAAIVADYDRDESLNDPETGYTPDGEKLTEEVVDELIAKIINN